MSPLADDCSLALLKDWMDRAGLKTLWDISKWENGIWQNWEKLEVPQNLSKVYADFLALLKGKASMNSRKKDSRGWGPIPGYYSVARGYWQISVHPHVPPDLKPWKGIWS